MALIGTVFLVSYVQNADLRAYNGAQLTKAYFVKEEIPAGTFGEDVKEFVEVREVPEAALAKGRVKDLTSLSGRVAAVNLQPGEQLISSRWIQSSDYDPAGGIAIPEGYQAITLALPVERVVGGSLKAGDTVGVFISADAAVGADGATTSATREALHRVLVLSVQPGTSYIPATDDAQANTEPVSVFMVTFALKTPDAEKLVWGQEYGNIWLSREPAKATTEGDVSVNSDLIFK